LTFFIISTIYIKIIIALILKNKMAGRKNEKTIEYAAITEQICDDFFAILTGCTGWFNSVMKSPVNNRTDYKSIDSKFRSVTIELKNRNIKISDYSTFLIEPDKFTALCQTGSTSDFTNCSWYINFLENTPDKFWIVDIKKAMYKPIYLKKNMKITLPELGTNYTYYADRLLIPKYYGHYYELDKTTNKYIKIW